MRTVTDDAKQVTSVRLQVCQMGISGLSLWERVRFFRTTVSSEEKDSSIVSSHVPLPWRQEVLVLFLPERCICLPAAGTTALCRGESLGRGLPLACHAVLQGLEGKLHVLDRRFK